VHQGLHFKYEAEYQRKYNRRLPNVLLD